MFLFTAIYIKSVVVVIDSIVPSVSHKNQPRIFCNLCAEYTANVPSVLTKKKSCSGLLPIDDILALSVGVSIK